MEANRREDGLTKSTQQGSANGSALEHYRLQEELGRGSFGVVFRATRIEGGEQLAIKMARENSPSSISSICEEYRQLAGLRAPGLVKVSDCGLSQADGLPWFGMELVEPFGGEELISSLGERDALLVFAQWLQTLTFIEDLGLLHGDLKPSNLAITREGKTVQGKIIDFGFAKRATSESPDKIRATPEYAAPEVLEGKPASSASDLYALGKSCRELGFAEMLDGQLVSILDRMCAEHEDIRYARSTSVLSDLDPILRAFGLEVAFEAAEQATFVARQVELNQLRGHLTRLEQGERGPAMIHIVGNHGVGKSRLVEESVIGLAFLGVRLVEPNSTDSETTIAPAGSRFLACDSLETDCQVLDQSAKTCREKILFVWEAENESPERIRDVCRCWTGDTENVQLWVVSEFDSITTDRTSEARIELGHLDERSAERLALRLLLGCEDRDEIAVVIASETAGIPEYICSAAIAVRSSRAMRSRIEHGLSVAMPDCMRVRASAQLRALPESMRAALCALSVFVGPVPVQVCCDLLTALVDVHESDFWALKEAGLLVVPSDQAAQHADRVLRRVAWGTLRESEREECRLHATQIIARIEDADAELLAEGVWISLDSTDSTSRTQLCIRAVTQYLKLVEPARARRLFEAGGLGANDAPDVRELWGDVLVGLGNAKEAEAVFRKLLSESTQSSDDIVLLRKIGAALKLQGRFPDALDLLQRARRRASAHVDSTEAALLCAELVPVLALTGFVEEAAQVVEEGLQFSMQAGSSKLCSDFHNDAGNLSLIREDFAGAHAQHMRALEIRRASADKDGISRSLANLASIASNRGQLAEAGRLYLESLELRRELGSPALLALSLTNLISVDLWRARYPVALDLLEESLSLQAVREDGSRRLEVRRQLCELWRTKAEYGRAWEQVVAAKESLKQAKVPALWSLKFVIEEASFYRAIGDVEQALTLYDRVRIEANRDDIAALMHQARAGVLRCSPPDEEQARTFVRELEDSLPLVVRLTVQLAACEVLLRSGCFDESRELAERVAARAQESGVPLMLAEARLYLARSLQDEGDGAQRSELIRMVVDDSLVAGWPELTIQARVELGRWHRSAGRIDRALRWYKQALDLLKANMEKLPSIDAREGYLSVPERAQVLREFRSMLRSRKAGETS